MYILHLHEPVFYSIKEVRNKINNRYDHKKKIIPIKPTIYFSEIQEIKNLFVPIF